ncbi:MAG: EamA family transporter [Thermoplasmatota archaeon]
MKRAAYTATYLLWGSTFLGIAIAVKEHDPLFIAASRFLLAGGIILVFAQRAQNDLPWPRAFVTGGFYLLGTHGIMSSLATSVPSGLLAVAMATAPMWIAVLEGNRKQIPTLLLGLAGVAVLAWPGGSVSIAQLAWLVGAAVSWAIGSVLTKRWGSGLPAASMAGRQMVAGGALLLAASGLAGETWAVPTGTSLAAVLYLAVFGSILTYFAYLYLIRTTTMARASSYTFVNPIVAVALGAWLASEPVTWRLFVALPLVLLTLGLLLRPARASPAAVAPVPLEASRDVHACRCPPPSIGPSRPL